MKTVVLFIPKDYRKATLRAAVLPILTGPWWSSPDYDRFFWESVDVIVEAGVSFTQGWQCVKIRRKDIPRAVAVLRFAGFNLIADENEIERTK